jgi:uncharacterized protein (DUF488 family)
VVAGRARGTLWYVTLWTIGHSTRPTDEFVALLTANHIAVVADVRRFPGSRRHPQFGREALAASLQDARIDYEPFPELGGRRPARPDSPNGTWRNDAFRGYADYMMTTEFREGIARLLSVAGRRRTTIMCAEAVWWQCHRGLIADYLKAAGHDVIHIMGANKTEPHPFTSAARVVDGALSYAPEPNLLS